MIDIKKALRCCLLIGWGGWGDSVLSHLDDINFSKLKK